MSIQRLSIEDFLQGSANQIILDVRSPGEFQQAHIPGATSFPLFSDEERKIIGTDYKQRNREVAIKTGLEFFGPRMRKMVEDAEAIASSKAGRSLFIYCWRGGMRSAAVAWLLDLYGFKVFTLAGGYKSFRNHILQSFEILYPFRILGGYTGSGKTEVLQELQQKGEKAIDLEDLASHKGSAFGKYGMKPQPTQEMFENRLGMELKACVKENDSSTGSNHIWLEDESQRIGNLNIPNAIWNQMRNAPLYFLDIDFQKRLAHLVAEYKEYDLTKLIESTQRISKRLGPLETKNTIAFLEEGNFEEAFRILLHYYDKRYLKGLHNRENISALLTRISCDSVDPGNVNLLTKYQPA